MTPLCNTRALPDWALAATVATTCVSLQLTTVAAWAVPSHTCPLPCAAPKAEPAMVTVSPGPAGLGVTPEIVGVTTVNATEFDHWPFCCTRALPDWALAATVATICVLLQLTTVAGAVPSQTAPVPRVSPKYEPPMVTCVPPVAVVGDTVLMEGTAITVKVMALLVPLPVVTLTLDAPGAAARSIVKVAETCVVLDTRTLLTDMPAPSATTFVPFTKLVPVKITTTVAPCGPLAGISEVSVGTEDITVNGSGLLVPAPEVTVTSAGPSAAAGSIVSPAMICVALMTEAPYTLTPGLLTETVASLAKLVPVRVTTTLFVPCAALVGLSEVNVGPGPVTVDTAALRVPAVAVTMIFAWPCAAVGATVRVTKS